MAIDFSEKTDDFLSEKLEDKTLIISYFMDFVPTIIALIFPFFIFLSVIFFTSRMAAKTEFIPMLTSGLSLLDIMKPYLIGSIMLGGVLVYANQELLPEMNTRKLEFLDKYVHKKKHTLFYDYYLRTDDNDYFTIKRFDTASKYGYEVGFFRLDSNQRMVLLITSKTLRFDKEANTWTMQSPLVMNVNNNGETYSSPQEYVLPFKLKMEEVIFKKYEKIKMTSAEILALIKKEKFKGKESVTTYEHEYYLRLAQPFSVIVMSLMGCIVSYRKIRGGSGFKITFGIAAGAMYFMLDKMSSVFSANLDYNPLISAWISNIIFIFVTLILYFKSPK